MLTANVEMDAEMAELREKLEMLKPRSDVLRFFHDGHRSWDATLYELLYWTRGISGCKKYEEFLFVYGRNGRNAKGSRIMLLQEAFGCTKTGGYICFQQSSFFSQHMEANKPDEATNAAVGCRLLVVDESGSNKTSEGAKAMVLDAATVKKFCDVAGTPIPYQPKYQPQDTTVVSWALLFYGNVVPEMRNADTAFKRRPSLMEISTEFVSQKDFDGTNKLHVLADERFRSRKYLGLMAPELILWMRRLLPALYVPSANSSSKLQPVPTSVRGFTEEAAGTEADRVTASNLKGVVTEWLTTCTRLVKKPGRRARGRPCKRWTTGRRRTAPSMVTSSTTTCWFCGTEHL
jgi:hypothetical protein